jgi:segregation and condensation protein B
MEPEQKRGDAARKNQPHAERAGQGKPDGGGDGAASKREVIGPKEMQRWGEAIRQRRRDLGLTLKQLADLTGISFGYLAKLERGDPDAKNPTRLVIDALRRALNIPAPGGEQLSRAALASWQSGHPQQALAAQNGQQPEAAPGAHAHAIHQRWQVAEALLLICGRLSAAQLAAGLDCGLFEVEETIQTLRAQLAGHGVVVQEMNGEYQLASDAALAPALRSTLPAIGLAPRRQTQLTQAQREVLALVIMHQPITRAAIERYRGVDSERPLHALIEAELVTSLPTTTPHGARQYISTLRVLEESGYSSLEALHQAISEDMAVLMGEAPGKDEETAECK